MNKSIESAVIVLLEEATDSLILTQRSASLREHPGEVCFPGGRWQMGDSDFLATALRELHEELGIEAARVRPIRPLHIVQTLSGYKIHPWLASIQHIDPYIANANEVDAVFTLSMNEVNRESNYQKITVDRQGTLIQTYQFTPSHYFVWGATAHIMRQLCGVNVKPQSG